MSRQLGRDEHAKTGRRRRRRGGGEAVSLKNTDVVYLPPASVPNPFNYALIGIGILGDVLWLVQLQAGAYVSLSAGGEH